MSRRSPRLISSGYYDGEESPSISYKETVYKVFKRQRHKTNKKGHRQDWSSDSKDNTRWSCNSDSREKRKGLKTFSKKMFGLLLLMFSLCFSSTLFSSLGRESSGPAIKHSKQQDEQLKYLPNLALESLGTRVSLERSSKSFQTQEAGLWVFGIPVRRPPKSPRTVIQGNSPLLPGNCWAFAGGRGHLFIDLSYPATISHVTLSHIPKNVSPSGSISSAPRLFFVYGLETLDGKETPLGTFLYDQEDSSFQTFKLLDHQKIFNHVKLQVESNWGHPEYTCLYSFGVHGKLAD